MLPVREPLLPLWEPLLLSAFSQLVFGEVSQEGKDLKWESYCRSLGIWHKIIWLSSWGPGVRLMAVKMGPSYLFKKEDSGLTMRERRWGNPARPAFEGGWLASKGQESAQSTARRFQSSRVLTGEEVQGAWGNPPRVGHVGKIADKLLVLLLALKSFPNFARVLEHKGPKMCVVLVQGNCPWRKRPWLGPIASSSVARAPSRAGPPWDSMTLSVFGRFCHVSMGPFLHKKS